MNKLLALSVALLSLNLYGADKPLTSEELKERYSDDPAIIRQQLLDEGYSIEEPPSWVDDEQRKKEGKDKKD